MKQSSKERVRLAPSAASSRLRLATIWNLLRPVRRCRGRCWPTDDELALHGAQAEDDVDALVGADGADVLALGDDAEDERLEALDGGAVDEDAAAIGGEERWAWRSLLI
jgi:hypothetical protein